MVYILHTVELCYLELSYLELPAITNHELFLVSLETSGVQL